MQSLFDRHKNVALSFGGGKDSLACLYLLKPYWDRLTVYWCNSGDAFPETVEQMAKIKAMVPNFKEVMGYQPEVVAASGWPSDVVSVMETQDGNAIFGKTQFRIQTRLQCCIRALMLPIYGQMRLDGVTCIIRGKRHDEPDRTGIESGHVDENGIEYWFPINGWTKESVYRYLSDNGIELPKFYKYGDHSHDCMSCTAWWGNGQAHYMQAEHPVEFIEYKRRIELVKRAVSNQMKKCEV